MMTNNLRDAVLETMDGVTLTSWSPFVGLITAITDWRAGTVTEASYTGYGTRPSVSFGVVGNTTPAGGRQKANDALVTFPQNTGSSQDVIAWGLWTAATAGTLRWIGSLDPADAPFIGIGQADDTIDAVGHGLVADQRVFVLADPSEGIPTGLSENTAYWVRATGLTADAFTLSTTQGGAAVNITVGGSALFIPYTALTVANLATPEFAIGALVAQMI
jgi:hypothetical protein